MNTNDLEAQGRVISWAGYADSVDKLEFMKAFSATMNSEEIHHLKRILGHRLTKDRTKKRKWVGQKWEDLKSKIKERCPEPPESRPCDESRPGGSERKGWWTFFKKRDTVAPDVEKVNLRGIKGKNRVKPGKIGIVGSDFKTILEKGVYHKPGSFLDGPKDSEVSGITRYDLQNGELWDNVKTSVKEVLSNKLVINVAGQNDFECMEIARDDYNDTFDLQQFYRRPHSDISDDTQPMSLRDIYFFHFKEDCLHHKPHNPVNDAKATMKIFLEGYIPLKLKSGKVEERGNIEEVDFSEAVKLKDKDKLGIKYCKPSDEFKSSCVCPYCTSHYTK